MISRKDIDNLYINHVIHSLAIAKFFSFKEGSSILDLGTGGGFPGIPLAIFFPECDFTLIDGRGKKIIVVKDVIEQLGLKNVKALHQRAEEHNDKHDFIVVRAVTTIDKLFDYAKPLIKKTQINPIPNGILALKGGDLEEELNSLKNEYFDEVALDDLLGQEYFPEKSLIYVQV